MSPSHDFTEEYTRKQTILYNISKKVEMQNTEAIFFITIFCLDCKYPGYFDTVRDSTSHQIELGPNPKIPNLAKSELQTS